MSQYVPENILQDSDIGGAEHMDLNDLMVGGSTSFLLHASLVLCAVR